uniref:Uncharacterized protein n=1 Tax=Oryza meridionalis TaxID=40149 RepID=A0A0E0CYX9_9ORYZ
MDGSRLPVVPAIRVGSQLHLAAAYTAPGAGRRGSSGAAGPPPALGRREGRRQEALPRNILLNEGIRAWMAAQDQPHENLIFPEELVVTKKPPVLLGGPGRPEPHEGRRRRRDRPEGGRGHRRPEAAVARATEPGERGAGPRRARPPARRAPVRPLAPTSGKKDPQAPISGEHGGVVSTCRCMDIGARMPSKKPRSVGVIGDGRPAKDGGEDRLKGWVPW